MVTKFTFINRQAFNPMVMLRNSCRHFCFVSRLITNFMRLTHPTTLRLKPAQSVYIKTSTHSDIISYFYFILAYAKLELWKIGCWFALKA